jgi:AcrR family transcriptional regulator
MSNPERRREAVYAAARLFNDKGYVDTTMDDIADAVGIAKPTLYHYFANKHEILFEIYEELMDILIGRQQQRIADGLSPEAQLLEAMADILELVETHDGHGRLFTEHFREMPPDMQRVLKEKKDQYESGISKFIKAAVKNGTFRKVNVDLATLALFGMCNWAYTWYRKGGSMSTREIAEVFWGYFFQGVGSETSLAAAAKTTPRKS